MSSILLIEDDADQRLLRKLILERAGHSVREAGGAAEAIASLDSGRPDCVLMDLRLPEPEDGLALISRLRSADAGLPVVVLSGWPGDIERTPQAAMVSELLRKPVRSDRLLQVITRLTAAMLFLCAPLAQGSEQRFESSGRGEWVAHLEMTAPGGDWARRGSEAAVARITVDGGDAQHVMVWNGETRRVYPVVLGRLPAGPRILKVERDPSSAGGVQLSVMSVRLEEVLPGSPRYDVIANAPLLYERENTRGQFSDIPMLMYATRVEGAIEYTVVFSNEDGGTSTRDLMARWGRASDIEFVYRVWPGSGGRPARTLIQTRNHKEVPYTGPYRDLHPLLQPVTDNNMVDAVQSPPARALLYRPLPIDFPDGEGSRERVMDADPATYRAVAKELEREKKLRPYGRFEGESIGDPRNYLYIEFESRLDYAWIEAVVLPRGSSRWFRSSLGIAGDHIESPGWRRVAVELPPGTREHGISSLAFSCLSSRKLVKEDVPKNGKCTLVKLGKVFFLDDDYRPRETLRFGPPSRGGESIGVGEMLAFEAF